jgi:hypothetical protein
MRLPRTLQRLLCKIGWHSWKKPRRVKGVRVRLCTSCPARQQWSFRGDAGWGWQMVVPPKRSRRKPQAVAQASSEIRPDQIPTRAGDNLVHEHEGLAQ